MNLANITGMSPNGFAASMPPLGLQLTFLISFIPGGEQESPQVKVLTCSPSRLCLLFDQVPSPDHLFLAEKKIIISSTTDHTPKSTW
jgi:hypothetical protein